MELMELPEELLQRIAECIAYDTGFVERHLPTYHWKYSTTPLLSLSTANHQLRRICLPFLFSCVEVELEDLEKLKDLCISSKPCALSIRYVVFIERSSNSADERIRALNFQNTPRGLREYPIKAIECLLNSVENLLQLNLPSIWIDIPLLALINRHPVPTVTVPGAYLLDGELLGTGDLSKFVFDHASISDESGRNELEPFITCGAQVRQLNMFRANLLEESVGAWQLHGLRELRLNLDQHAATFAWISDFAYANSHLRKISFTTSFSRTTNVLCDPRIPFVNSFVEKACQAGLDNDWTIRGFSVTRRRRAGSAAPTPGDLSEWYVSGLNLNFCEWSYGRLLQIAHSFFPQLSVLSIDVSAPFVCSFTSVGF